MGNGTLVCAACGATNNPPAAFCVQCGGALPVTPPAGPPPTAIPPPAPAIGAPGPADGAPSPPAKRSPSKQLVIAAIVVVAAVVGTVIFLASRDNNNKTPQAQSTFPAPAGSEGPQAGVRRWTLPQRSLTNGPAERCNALFTATNYVDIERLDEENALMTFPPSETVARTISLEVTANGFKGTLVQSGAVVTTLGAYNGSKLRLLTLAYGRPGDTTDEICAWRWDLPS